MNFIERVKTHASTLVTGVIAAFLISLVFDRLLPGSRLIIFAILTGFWLAGGGLAIFQEWRSAGSRVFANPKEWDPKLLPKEFQFITLETALTELTSKLGEYQIVASESIARYDLPSGGAIFVYLEEPLTSKSHVVGVQYYPNEGEVPVFPS